MGEAAAGPERPAGPPRPRADGTLPTADLVAALPVAPPADVRWGVGPPETARLYDQAVAAAWDPSRDVPWAQARRGDDVADAALADVMACLAVTSAATLSTLAGCLARLPAAHLDVKLFLATAVADAARHADGFRKRAWLAGGPRTSDTAATPPASEPPPFLDAMFLRLVVHDGAFFDLLRFVAEHAPDEATRRLADRVGADVSRRVHFGLALVRHASAADAALPSRLEAVAAAADAWAGPASSPTLVAALTTLAARTGAPADPSSGARAVLDLARATAQHHVRRLVAAGFPPARARAIVPSPG